jgi:hypothetical protein
MFNWQQHHTKPFNKIEHIVFKPLNYLDPYSAELTYRNDLKADDISQEITERTRAKYNFYQQAGGGFFKDLVKDIKKRKKQ